jgi:hypothetical protein
MLRWLIVLTIVSGVLAVVYFTVASRTDTFTGRWVAWKSSDVDDFQRFPHRICRPHFTLTRVMRSSPLRV